VRGKTAVLLPAVIARSFIAYEPVRVSTPAWDPLALTLSGRRAVVGAPGQQP